MSLSLLTGAQAHQVESLSSYFDLLKASPHLLSKGKRVKGEIEVSRNLEEIESISKSQVDRLIKKGVSASDAIRWSTPGIVASDPYLIWVRDPVIFPNGDRGLFKRIIWTCTLNGERPVAVLPIDQEGKILLIKTWRHATGSWEFEIPRGAPGQNESSESVARRELAEETGCLIQKLFPLGSMNPDSGILATSIDVFIAFGKCQIERQLDSEEVITGVFAFSQEEINQGLLGGSLRIKGGEKVPLRDPFLTFALYQAKIRKLL